MSEVPLYVCGVGSLLFFRLVTCAWLRVAAGNVYRVFSKLKTHTALGPYIGAMPRSIGPS